MATEYIKRDDAINGFVQMLKQPGDIYPTDITTMLQSIPPADVRPVVKGRWIVDDIADNIFHCSICDGDAPIDCTSGREYESDFCHNCGADMRGW